MLLGIPRLLFGVIWTTIMRSAVTKFKNRRFDWAYWTKDAAKILINNRGLAQHINVDKTVKI